MNRLSKAILITLGGVAVLGIGGLFAANAYVHSADARSRVQEQLSRALGVPVELTDMEVGWSGLRLAGVRIATGPRPLLEATSFSADYRLLPLLRRQLEIRKITLESPHILWAQNADGKWVLPLLPVKGRKQLPSTEVPKVSPDQSRKEGFEVSLEAIEIKHGSIELLDAQQKRVILATDVDTRYSIGSAAQVEGTLSASSLNWKDTLLFTEVHSPIRFAQGELFFPELRAKLAGGDVRAKLSMQTEAKDSPFQLSLDLNTLDLAQLTKQSGWLLDQVTGTLGGTLELNGNLQRLDRTAGTGKFTLRDGRLRALGLLETAGQILQIPQLSDIRFREGHADIHLGDAQTSVDELVLETGDLQIGSKGTIRFDGKLGLAVTLAVSPTLAAQLPSFVRNAFTAPDPAGRQSITFKLSGKTDHPKNTLVNSIIGQKMDLQVDSLLGGLFGLKKEKKKKKDKPPEEEVRAAPSDPTGTPVPAAPATPPTPAAPEGAAPAAASAVQTP